MSKGEVVEMERNIVSGDKLGPLPRAQVSAQTGFAFAVREGLGCTSEDKPWCTLKQTRSLSQRKRKEEREGRSRGAA